MAGLTGFDVSRMSVTSAAHAGVALDAPKGSLGFEHPAAIQRVFILPSLRCTASLTPAAATTARDPAQRDADAAWDLSIPPLGGHLV